MKCDGRPNFYVFVLGMIFADDRTHLPKTMSLSAISQVASMILHRVMHVFVIDNSFYQLQERCEDPNNWMKVKFNEKLLCVKSVITLRIKLLCSERDLVFWKCSRFLLKASSSNLSVSSSASSSPNVICPPFKFDFLARLASSLILSAKSPPPPLLGLSSDSIIGLKVVFDLFCGELPLIFSVDTTTVSRLVDVVEFDNVPSWFWFTLLYPCWDGSSWRNLGNNFSVKKMNLIRNHFESLSQCRLTSGIGK